MSTERDSLPPPPWSSERKKARRPLSREVLTEAALKIVDAEGLEALSMRRLAEDLDAVPSAIYAHVSDKPELLQLMIDRVSADFVVPKPDPRRWQEQMREACRSMYAVLVKHRDLGITTLGDIPTGHNALRFTDGLLAIMRAGKLPKLACAYAIDALPLYICSSAYERSVFSKRLEKEPKYFQQLHAYFRALPKERFPAAAEMVDELISEGEGEDSRFEFGLDLMIRGLGTWAPAQRKR